MLSREVYRQSEEAAREVAEALIPQEITRRQCLSLLADSIVQAHGNGRSPGVWAVTLGSQGFIRLNVGVIEMYALFADTVHLVLDYTLMSKKMHEDLIQLGSHYGGWLPSYPRVPNSEMWNIPATEILPAMSITAHPYQALLTQAVDSVHVRTGYYIHHSSGVLDYLRNFLQRELPSPDHTRGAPKRRRRQE